MKAHGNKTIGCFLRSQWIQHCRYCFGNRNQHSRINMTSTWPHTWRPDDRLTRHRSELTPSDLAPCFPSGCSVIN